ncbi:MAG TPA: T9SS type A sorting domain-containing protein [Bacteroidales bacterium]|nr:T9SS type A sorting domain-containing protein [Bacteroidales bacterium]
MKKTITTIISLMFVLSSYCQFAGQYTINVGGDDYINVLKSDGTTGFYMAGTIGQSGNYDASFIRTNGVLTSAFSYGSTGTEYGTDLTMLNDGNVLITGRTNSFNGGNDFDVLLVKINPSDGSVIWSKAIGTDSTEYGFKAINSADGNILVTGPVTGNNKTDMMVLKVSNTDGHVIFATKTGFQYSNDTPYDIKDLGGTNGIVVMGYSGAGLIGMNDICAAILDSTAKIVEDMFFGGAGDEEGRVLNINFGGDGYVYIAGTTGSYGAGGNDFFVQKLKVSPGMPAVKWFKTYGGTGNENLTAFELNEQGFLLGGLTSSYGAATEGLLVQIDTAGTVIWSKNEGTVGDDNLQGIMIDTTNNLNIVVGYTNFWSGSNNDGFLIVANSDGTSGTCDGNPGIIAQSHTINDSIQFGITTLTTDTMNVVETGAGISAVSLTPTFSQVCPVSVESFENSDVAVYPNPFSGNIIITTNFTTEFDIEIFDINSRVVYTRSADSKSIEINLSALPAGIYTLVCKTRDTVTRSKIVKY